MKESQLADQLRYHTGPNQGYKLVHASIHWMNLWTVGAWEGHKPTDPKEQELHDRTKTGCQSGALVRAHYPWYSRKQRPPDRPMTHSELLQVKMDRLKSKRCVSRVHSTVSFCLFLFSFFFCFLFCLVSVFLLNWFYFVVEAARAEDRFPGTGK